MTIGDTGDDLDLSEGGGTKTTTLTRRRLFVSAFGAVMAVAVAGVTGVELVDTSRPSWAQELDELDGAPAR